MPKRPNTRFSLVLASAVLLVIAAGCSSAPTEVSFVVDGASGSIEGYGSGDATLADRATDPRSSGTLAADGAVEVDFHGVTPGEGDPLVELSDSFDASCDYAVENGATEIQTVSEWTAYDEADASIGTVFYGSSDVIFADTAGSVNIVIHAEGDASFVTDGTCQVDAGPLDAAVDLQLEEGWNAVNVASDGSTATYAMGFDTDVDWTFEAF